MKKWLAALAAVSTVCVVAPQIEATETTAQQDVKQHEALSYETFIHKGQEEVRIVGFDKAKVSDVLRVPETIDGKRVTEIGDFAFGQIEQKTELELPSSIRTIGDSAFGSGWKIDITTLTNVEEIRRYAFRSSDVYNSKPFVLPKTLHTVGEWAFAQTDITDVTIGAENQHIGSCAFAFMNELQHVTLEEGVTTIAAEIFSGNPKLQHVTFPSTVTSIGESAFLGSGLTTVDFSSARSLIDIGIKAFQGNKLKTITLPLSLQQIGDLAFAHNQLTSIVIPPSVTSMGGSAFMSNKLKTLELPNSLETIEAFAFAYNKLTAVVIPSGVTSIQSYAFELNELTTLHLPATLEIIESQAFARNKLQSMTLPNSLHTIGSSAFMQNELTSVTMPEQLRTIERYAFAENKLQAIHVPRIENAEQDIFSNNALTNVTFAQGVTTIGEGMFMNNALQSIQLPNTITRIERNAFTGNKLTHVELPSSLTYLNGFSNNALTNVIIPSGVTHIGNEAFARNQLTSVTLPNTVTRIDADAFRSNALAQLELPSSIEHLSGFARNKLTSVTIPSGVTHIDNDAFMDNELQSVTLSDTVEHIGAFVFANNHLTNVTLPSNVKTASLSAFTGNPLATISLQGSDTTLKRATSFVNNNGAAFKALYTDTYFTEQYNYLDEANGTPIKLFVAFTDTKPAPPFSDIANHWAQGAIESFTDLGYINGYPDGTFKPGASIQRKHVARILNDVFKFEATQNVTDFKDVPKSHPYYAAISAVQKAGIFSGNNGEFQPEANLTRGQLAKVLVLAAGFEPGGKATFADTPDTYWGTPYVSTLADLAIVKGTDGLFNPHKPITRAQFVSMTSLALAEMERRAND